MKTFRYFDCGIFKALILFSSLLFANGPGFAFSPTGYPGAVWMLSGRDTSGIDGTNTQGMVRQGVELLRLSGGRSLQVYGRYNWRYRNINQDYYNAYTPYVGTMFSFKRLDLGAEFGWPRYTALSNSSRDYNIFANWSRYWGLKEWSRDSLIKALPFSTWGNASYDLGNQNGSSTMGWAKLEADLFWLPHNFMAGPYASYNWRLRTRNADYFNINEVCAGFEIGNGEIELGTQYAWRRYPKINQRDRGLELFITIYKAWDLKPKNSR
ncbi:MAG: hypothetical protein NTX59_02015 [Elusimicrobia bacterium]|nr:hypothetical protein [Elusimicrobiota bacterium]